MPVLPIIKERLNTKIVTMHFIIGFDGKNEEESVASNEVHLSTCRGIGFQGWYGGNWGLCQMVIQGIIFIKND